MRIARMLIFSAVLVVSLCGLASCGSVHTRKAAGNEKAQEQGDWPVYNGGPGEDHYSYLTQINRSNVNRLQVAWTYDTGKVTGLETNPIIIDGVLYAFTPSLKVVALNAATGKLLWKFDSGIDGTRPDRGLTYWASGKDKRIFAGIMNFVYALDTDTGKPISSFGSNGRIDLRENLGRDPSSVSIELSSPGIVYKNLLIVGGAEPETLPCAPGDIRAYDVRTGGLRWSFHTIPHPGEFGYDTWPRGAWKYAGAANNWAGMALDVKRGIVYVPTGSASFDFYKANELGNDLFANCLVALNAETGKLIWYFQGVRHDLWDRDFDSPPALVAVKRNGREIDAVAQAYKQGVLYVFDRINGKPLFPIEYRKYSASSVPGEAASTEQPLPTKPAPFARQILTEALLTNRTPQAHQWAVEQFRKFRSAGPFVPLSVERPTVVFPSFEGGAEWGGDAVDPKTGILYVNANDYPSTGELAKKTVNETNARGLYMSQCSYCHGANRAGSPPQFPSLVGVEKRLSSAEITKTIRQGQGRMPGFPNLSHHEILALVKYLTRGENTDFHRSAPGAINEPYRFTGYLRFQDRQGYPAVKPPWGTLNAIDLNTGNYVWRIPLGDYPALAAQGVRNTGSENYGGPVVTAGGLLFIGATAFDRKFRAFDAATGKLLWEATLPFAGGATPATYEVNGRQYVVIAAAGGGLAGVPTGGIYVAFALPR
jgi:quinoprotein glucose dehydrogenase